MNTYGNPSDVAFRVGLSPSGPSFRHVQIIVANTALTDEPNTYVPGFLGGLVPEVRAFESRLNWLEHEEVINRFRNLTEAHNALLHVDSSAFLPHEDPLQIAESLRIFDYGCPETDGFAAFLLPFSGALYITFQLWSRVLRGYERVTRVDGTQINHASLILAQRSVINELSETA
jgi:hypothetical protein